MEVLSSNDKGSSVTPSSSFSEKVVRRATEPDSRFVACLAAVLIAGCGKGEEAALSPTRGGLCDERPRPPNSVTLKGTFSVRLALTDPPNFLWNHVRMGLLDFRCIFFDCQFWVAFFDDVGRVAGAGVAFFWSRLELPGSLEV